MRASILARSVLPSLSLLFAACVSTSVQVTDPTQGVRPLYQERAAVRVVVISAVEQELQTLLQSASVERTVTIGGRTHYVGRMEGHPVVLFLGGVSMVNAAMSTQAVIDYFDVGGIVFSGIAGGVNPHLHVGDVTVPAQWGQHQEMVFARKTAEGWDTGGRAPDFENFGMMFTRGQLIKGGAPGPRPEQRQFWFSVDGRMLTVARGIADSVELARCLPSGKCLEHAPKIVVGGNGVSGPTFVNNAEFRQWIWRVFQADAVDMETAAIAQVAFVNEVPFLAFRSLSDLAGGGPGANEIETFADLAAGNSATVLVEFLRAWRGPG